MAISLTKGSKEFATFSTFTLIELLIVITIIIILVAILLPVLTRVRESARRVLCMNNQRQLILTFKLYADDHRDTLPSWDSSWSTSISADAYYVKDAWDLRSYIQLYIDPSPIYICPSLGNSPITDPRNTRFICYGPFLYFPGKQAPEFDHSGEPHPVTFSTANPALPFIQDRCRWLGESVLLWVFNHGRGDFREREDNPSGYARITYGDPLPPEIDGCNIGYYDGSVRWVSRSQLQDCGRDQPTGSYPNARVYSTMP